MIETVGTAIVVTAQTFNPSIFTQLWLSKQQLVAEGDFAGSSISNDGVAQHELANMQLLVIPPRLQVTITRSDDASAEKGRALVAGIVRKLPETPYQALGMNLDFLVGFEEQDFASVDRAMFLKAEGPFAETFSEGTARFGGYFSRDVNGIRMKLDIKPFPSSSDAPLGDKLHCCFNYQLDLKKEDYVNAICSALAKWHELKAQAVVLLKKVESFKARS